MAINIHSNSIIDTSYAQSLYMITLLYVYVLTLSVLFTLAPLDNKNSTILK